jgi:uncharacterized protein (UPF0332 family)
MFNFSRAALLESGVPEGDLPRTHRGIIEAFRKHAVLSGRIEHDLASNLSKAENLRLMADYTAAEVDPAAAAGIVEQAERYVRTVERVFALEQSKGLESHTAEQQRSPSGNTVRAISDIDEMQRKAAEEWSKRQQQAGDVSQTLEDLQKHGRENWQKPRQSENVAQRSGELNPGRKDTGEDLARGMENDLE